MFNDIHTANGKTMARKIVVRVAVIKVVLKSQIFKVCCEDKY